MSSDRTRAAGVAARGAFPQVRMRRLRQHPLLRDMVRETTLSLRDFILPLFVRAGRQQRVPIGSMPGQFQLSVPAAAAESREAVQLGLPAVLLFGIPERKDAVGSAAWEEEGVVQQALRAIRDAVGDRLLLFADLCFCEYTDHGHCGVLSDRTGRTDVDNDATLANLARQALSLARAGADCIAPSGMMDGMVAAIRQALDQQGFEHVAIMSYAAKYASAFYGPFREAAESAPQFGDRRSYQMDPANAAEALREVALDVQEGADIVMVKPALAYLDVVRRVKERFGLPVAAYNVSGEYSMVKAAAERGWLDERTVAMEILTGIKRAGADMIISYFAKDLARWLAA